MKNLTVHLETKTTPDFCSTLQSPALASDIGPWSAVAHGSKGIFLTPLQSHRCSSVISTGATHAFGSQPGGGWSRRGLAGWLCFRPQAWPSQLCFIFCSGQLLGLPISWQDLRHKGQVQIYKCTSKPAWITPPNLLPSETNHMAELLEENFVSKLGLSSEVEKLSCLVGAWILKKLSGSS